MLWTTETLGYKLNHVSPEKISQNFVSNTEKIAQLMGKEIRCIVHNSKNKLQDILLISKTNIMIDAIIQVYGKAILKKMRSYPFFSSGIQNYMHILMKSL